METEGVDRGAPTGSGSVPAALRELLAHPPLWEKRVLEIGFEWHGLAPQQAWAASRLRAFLLTWDPFEWQPDRAAAFATSTSRADGAGMVLYLPHWQAAALAGGEINALPGVLGRLAESVLTVASEQEGAITDGSYPAGVQEGSRPELLSRIPADAALAPPTLSLVGDGWQEIQFDVLEDLAQDGYGPADLDRSPVHFSEPGEGRSGCPGCAGEAIDFPDGLKDAQEAICAAHRTEALQITTARLEAAKASNPAGWEALLDAGQRLLEPHLPNGLGPRLAAAATAAQVGTPTTDELVGHAALVTEAASLMTGLPDPQTALGGRLAPVRAWLEHLPADLAAHGQEENAAAVQVAAEELLMAPSAAELEAAAAAATEEEVAPKPQPYRREIRVGRNAPCPCGSGQKYKFCHGRA